LTGADLRGAILSWARLAGANLARANLAGASLRNASLEDASLAGANLGGANLREAWLENASLTEADLDGADLFRAELRRTDFTKANLRGANLSEARLSNTIFAEVDLTNTLGLDNLPSCFISFSAKDQLFAARLHADLQNKGVRCWFAPHDLPIGAKTWDAIDEAIRLRDKLLLILSKPSIASEWVEDEVNKAYAEERSSKEVVLFPIRINNAAITTAEPRAVKLRDQRNIGDFRQWKRPAQYQKSLDRLLRDLKASGEK
jgi:uncharacterized protein YjbI with pentapeptide repeats